MRVVMTQIKNLNEKLSDNYEDGKKDLNQNSHMGFELINTE